MHDGDKPERGIVSRGRSPRGGMIAWSSLRSRSQIVRNASAVAPS